MSNATAIPNAIPVDDYDVYDGVAWFLTSVHDLSYDTYKVLPKVVSYKGKQFVKMSFNTDTGYVAYKESKAVAI